MMLLALLWIHFPLSISKTALLIADMQWIYSGSAISQKGLIIIMVTKTVTVKCPDCGSEKASKNGNVLNQMKRKSPSKKPEINDQSDNNPVHKMGFREKDTLPNQSAAPRTQ
jgi:hypothetical protein